MRFPASTGVGVPSSRSCMPSCRAFVMIVSILSCSDAACFCFSRVSLACPINILTIRLLPCVSGLSDALCSFGPCSSPNLLNPAPNSVRLFFAARSVSSSMVVFMTCPVLCSPPWPSPVALLAAVDLLR